MTFEISVIVCTHNPRRDYMPRVLEAIYGQTFSQERWQLLIVDNASNNPVIETYEKNCPSNCKFLYEKTLGLTAARIRGIKESDAPIIVFVDDDNVLDLNYLEEVIKVAERCPYLGVWGGQRIAECEETPPSWSIPYLGILSISEFGEERWHNFSRDPGDIPTGAGMCVHRNIAETYVAKVARENWRLKLDRVGNALMSCGDFDLVFTAQKLGAGVGLFPSLRLWHLIPKERLAEQYLLKLREEISLSIELLDLLDGKAIVEKKKYIKELIRNLYWRIKLDNYGYKFHAAHLSGIERALAKYETLINV